MAISQVRLMVPNFDACFRFYHDVMALHVLWGAPGDAYAGFRLAEGASLTIFRQPPSLEASEAVPGQDRVVLIFNVEALEGSVKQLERAGARFESGPTDYPEWGVRAAHLRDPAGNLLEISTPLPKAEWSEELKEAARWHEPT